MKATIYFYLLFIVSFSILTAPDVHAETVNYTLENVILDDNNAQMLGSFSWTYEVGDFENGVGQFDFLDIPFTLHDHTDLTATFDIGSSIEITLEGSVHDDGVDITLFLLQPLTPTSGSDIDLAQSRYEIGGNGFHTGMFLSGSIVPSGVVAVGDLSTRPIQSLTAYPNPFNPSTTIVFEIADHQTVNLRIFDLKGRLVRTLIDHEEMSPGRKSFPWDGKDDRGRPVPTGTYAYAVSTENYRDVQKMVLLK